MASEFKFELKLAETEAELRASQRLRYEVFVAELGGDGPMVDHAARLECDRFDPFMQHMLLFDRARPGDMEGQLVGVYRMMDSTGAAAAGGFYSESEYDLAPLHRGGRKLLEFGRSCVHRDYRGGPVMHRLWQGLIRYVDRGGYEVLFGTASFHGTDLDSLAPALTLLAERYLAPADLRVRARPYAEMCRTAPDQIDRVAAMRQVPALIKAYLKLGGFIGDGAFVDHAFNTTDVCLLLDVARANPKQLALYRKDRP